MVDQDWTNDNQDIQTKNQEDRTKDRKPIKMVKQVGWAIDNQACPLVN
jgi:hypothetical protein